VKDAIGEWHDWQELAGIARGTLGHGSGCQLVKKLERTVDQKYKNALALSENMRKKYLQVSDRTKNKRTAQPRDSAPAQPVWQATAALSA
jgi:hypothetical protein